MALSRYVPKPLEKYVELRCRSAFSFLDGASLPEDLVTAAAAAGHDTLALADVNGLYGAPRFYGAARRAGLRAIVGAEVSRSRPRPRPSSCWSRTAPGTRTSPAC